MYPVLVIYLPPCLLAPFSVPYVPHVVFLVPLCGLWASLPPVDSKRCYDMELIYFITSLSPLFVSAFVEGDHVADVRRYLEAYVCDSIKLTALGLFSSHLCCCYLCD